MTTRNPNLPPTHRRPTTAQRQVWATPTAEMQCEWLGERVATVDVGRAIANVVHGREDAGWGPNAVFRFPKSGGTGAMWKGVAALLPGEGQVGARCVDGIGWETQQPPAAAALVTQQSARTQHTAYPPTTKPSTPTHQPQQRYNQRVTAISKEAKTVTLASGEVVAYEKLLTTLPLDITLRWLGKAAWADGLVYSSSHIVGIGIRGKW